MEAENEGEEELLSQVVEAVGAMVKKNLNFVPSFATVFYPMCMELLGDGYGDVEKRLALCAFDDFVEHGASPDPPVLPAGFAFAVGPLGREPRGGSDAVRAPCEFFGLVQCRGSWRTRPRQCCRTVVKRYA